MMSWTRDGRDKWSPPEQQVSPAVSFTAHGAGDKGVLQLQSDAHRKSARHKRHKDFVEKTRTGFWSSNGSFLLARWRNKGCPGKKKVRQKFLF